MQALDKLKSTVEALLTPETGCPWHQKQNFQTLSGHTLSESYELIDALNENNPEDIKEELGDLLYQIFLYCQHAEKKNMFTLNDVADYVNDKVVRRHPWVFEKRPDDPDFNIGEMWDKIKREEKKAKGDKIPSLMDSIPAAAPALSAAHDIQKRAIAVGFKWENMNDFYKQIDEELAEVKEAVASGDADHIEEELGDLLFTVAIMGCYSNHNPELALKRANKKFASRFLYVEQKMHKDQMPMSFQNMPSMEKYWQEAKALEKQGQLEQTLKASA